MTKNEQSVTGTCSPQQVAADLFRIGENPSLPAWQYPVLQQAIRLLAAAVEPPAGAPIDAQICQHCDCIRPLHDLDCPVAIDGAKSALAPADEKASFDYDDVVSVCDAHGICLPVDYVDMVVDIVKRSGLLATRRATANKASAEVFTYATKQATACASCGEYKHTPLRIDRMGGYVCLTCIDRELERPVTLADDQRAAVEFALGACAGHVAGERHVSALESLLSSSREAQ
ncbi:hypothetical protein [Burkholderia pseudomallei]|uniref:hypothetical protein n=1 Tax=Burkholderia pseudomallei TaxID=28450 RepID=UPI000A1A1773|nr:hypothetical protein [Burkholderia pseudomallei]ARL36038.1 hypothetical protein BOC49_07010 [Burkholderia pseudomallei]